MNPNVNVLDIWRVNKLLQKAKENILLNIFRYTIILIFLVFLLKNRIILVFLIFLTLDIIASYVATKFSFGLFADYLFIGSIFFAKYVSLHIAILMILIIPIPRLFLGKFQSRYLTKMPYAIASILLVPILDGISFPILTLLIISIRYILEYAIGYFVFSSMPTRLIIRGANIVGGYLFMSLFGSLLVTLL
ncbi:MAG: hypothetical protein V1859_07885 [archaeon]